MRLFAGCIAILFAVACTGGDDKGEDYSAILDLEGDATAGGELFADNCATCHGSDGTGVSGPSLIGMDDENEIIEYVLNGEDAMPAFDFTDQEMADVLAYILSEFN